MDENVDSEQDDNPDGEQGARWVWAFLVVLLLCDQMLQLDQIPERLLVLTQYSIWQLNTETIF